MDGRIPGRFQDAERRPDAEGVVSCRLQGHLDPLLRRLDSCGLQSVHGSVTVVTAEPDARRPRRRDDVEIPRDDEQLAQEPDEQDRLVAQDFSAVLRGSSILNCPADLRYDSRVKKGSSSPDRGGSGHSTTSLDSVIALWDALRSLRDARVAAGARSGDRLCSALVEILLESSGPRTIRASTT